MKRKINELTIGGAISYEADGKTFRGGGQIQNAYFVRKSDGFVSVDDLTVWAGGPNTNRDLQLSIGSPLMLPNFLADLALALPDDEETADDFNRRLNLRDELAKAFADAADKLKTSPIR